MNAVKKYQVMKFTSGFPDNTSLFAIRGRDGSYNPIKEEVVRMKYDVFGKVFIKENVKTNGDVCTIYSYPLFYSVN